MDDSSPTSNLTDDSNEPTMISIVGNESQSCVADEHNLLQFQKWFINARDHGSDGRKSVPHPPAK